jgi:hypothetical protein
MAEKMQAHKRNVPFWDKDDIRGLHPNVDIGRIGKTLGAESWISKRTGRNQEGVLLELECPQNQSMRFEVELHTNPLTGMYAITLHGRIKPREAAAICRYDVQDGPHVNTTAICGNGTTIARLVPHKHIYNAGAIVRFLSWSHCAEIVPQVRPGVRFTKRDLLGWFLAQMQVHFTSTDAHGKTFQWWVSQ